jgi:riboflavin synthase
MGVAVFTGIVEELGYVTHVRETSLGNEWAIRLTVAGPLVCTGVAIGDSIAVSGVCLTVVESAGGEFSADVMLETLVRSTLATANDETPVNLERAATLQTRLGGHLVQGHVDGVGSVLRREHTPNWDVVEISLPSELARYVVEKGSISVDGVSLTVAAVSTDSFTVSLIPTTLARTTLGAKEIGEGVNLEVDVMAKYAERLLGFAGVKAYP